MNEGSATRERYRLGCERIAPPCLAWSQSFLTWRQKMRATTHEQADAAEDDGEGGRRVMVLAAEADVEGRGHREEEIEIDEGAGGDEEDLLDEVGGDGAPEGRRRDDRDEHQQRHERAEIRGQEAVAGDPDGVGGEDRP